MMRKMVLGPRGRYSTDLDFTRRPDIGDEDIMKLMLDALWEFRMARNLGTEILSILPIDAGDELCRNRRSRM